MFFADTMAEVGKFMDSGGMVLWAIVVLLFVMWTLIFERMWYLRSSVGTDVQGAIDTWEGRGERTSKRAHQIREKLISEVSIKIDENLMMIKTLDALAPLFGLLGTVTGMTEISTSEYASKTSCQRTLNDIPEAQFVLPSLQ